MSDAPKRWLEDESSSARVRELLASARPTPSMPAEIQAASAAQVAKLAGKSALSLGAKLVLGVLAVGIAVGLSLGLGVFEDSNFVGDARLGDRRGESVSSPTEPPPVAPQDLQAVAPEVSEPETPEQRDEENPTPTLRSPSLTPPTKNRTPTREANTETEPETETETETEDDSQTQDTLAAEVALIERGRANITRNPAVALEAATEHLQTFPHGQLSAAAQLIAIDALVRLDRRGEAIAHARAMLQRFPGSIYRERLVRLVGEDALE